MATVPNPTRPHNPGQQQHSTGGGTHTGGTSSGGGTGLGETAHQAASRVSDAASSVVQGVENAWDSTTQGVQNAWDSTTQGVSRGAEYVADKAGDFWGDATNMVRRYPVASVLIAFGMGCLAASLFRVPNWTDDIPRRMSRSSM